MLGAGILLFILATSNPFRRIFPPPADGAMLNPLLQDVALALHPPFLYLGYVGFSAVFSLVVAALICGKIDRNWAVIAHPFIMFSWSMLTVGITLGSWWAYRELGWGGFWFWDPVENASLLPWLAATALLHSNIALSKRGIFSRLVALLAIGTFALSLIGIFLVRSGVITSVHSFANDPQRGIYILCYIAVVIGSALYLYARADKAFLSAAPLRPVSREGMIALNNLFLLTACATLLLGTLYPLLVDALGWQAISIGAPYFNRTILPLIAAGLLFAGLVAFVPWKKGRVVRILQRSWLAWILAALVLLLILSGIGLSSKAFAAAAGFALAAWLLGGSADWLADGRWRRFSQWPVFLAHVGMAVLVVGITGCGLWSRQSDLAVSPGDSFSFAGYKVIFSKLEQVTNPNYDATRAVLIISRAEGKSRHLMPEYRSYAISGSFTSEAAIYSTLAYDFYAVIGETNAEGKTALRLYYKPTISCLWLGASLVSLGGLFAAFASIKAARRRTK